MIELKVESGKYGQIVLIIENLSKEDITLKDVTLLWSVDFFDYSEISNIGFFEGQLHPGNFWPALQNTYEISIAKFHPIFFNCDIDIRAVDLW